MHLLPSSLRTSNLYHRSRFDYIINRQLSSKKVGEVVSKRNWIKSVLKFFILSDLCFLVSLPSLFYFLLLLLHNPSKYLIKKGHHDAVKQSNYKRDSCRFNIHSGEMIFFDSQLASNCQVYLKLLISKTM